MILRNGRGQKLDLGPAQSLEVSLLKEVGGTTSDGSGGWLHHAFTRAPLGSTLLIDDDEVASLDALDPETPARTGD